MRSGCTRALRHSGTLNVSLVVCQQTINLFPTKKLVLKKHRSVVAAAVPVGHWQPARGILDGGLRGGGRVGRPFGARRSSLSRRAWPGDLKDQHSTHTTGGGPGLTGDPGRLRRGTVAACVEERLPA